MNRWGGGGKEGKIDGEDRGRGEGRKRGNGSRMERRAEVENKD